MKNRSLGFKHKIIGLVLFGVINLLALGYLGRTCVESVGEAFDHIAEVNLKKIQFLGRMVSSAGVIFVHVNQLFISDLPDENVDEAFRNIKYGLKQYGDNDKKFNNIPITKGEEKLYQSKRGEWENFLKKVNEFLKMANQERIDPRDKVLLSLRMDIENLYDSHQEQIENLISFHESEAHRWGAFADETASRNLTKSFLLVVFISILFLFIGIWFAISVSKSIEHISQNLLTGISQVASSSTQVASSSQKMAQASVEQASSLEETAASLEEITAMISKAAENAGITASSTSESQRKAESGHNAVEQMLVTMNEITQSNEAIKNQIVESNQKMHEIVNVIQEIGSKTKVINEIVFQTKLLSFNASVEAARSGEHGKGFAVVAEEVGSLAQMSGNAAKEITEMLEKSILKVESIVSDTKSKVESLIEEGRRKVESGVRVADQCSNALREIVTNITKVSSLAHEISQATKEQGDGVREINKAMGLLDSVSQQNSAASEEVASVAEHLSTQSESMQLAVNQLVTIIKGRSA